MAPGRRDGRGPALLALSGCAAVTNPVAEGVPVDRLPPDFFPQPREEEKTIPLTLLRQKPPDAYRLDVGDVLGIYIEGILGDKTQPPPVHYSELGNVPPALGYPIPIRDDGAVPLPLVGSVPVKGLTVPDAEKRIIKAYTVDNKYLQPDREDHRHPGQAARVPRPRRPPGLRRGDDRPGGHDRQRQARHRRGGRSAGLRERRAERPRAHRRPAGPGRHERGRDRARRRRRGRTGGPHGCFPCLPGAEAGAGAAADGRMIHIPLRTPPGEAPSFRPEDVVLQTGDIVFIEARDTEVFYVGGLLLPRQFVLPRDYDLRVVDAVALAGGPLVNGLQTQNNLSGAIVQSGLGSPSPSLLTVLRKTKCQGEVKIKVDLNRALNDPRENILVQAGDVLILQETPGEAITRYVTTVLRFEYLATFINNSGFNATSTANLP